MKIIKRGKNPGPESQEPLTLTCSGCETIIETSHAEMTRQWDQRDGDYYEIKCPVCDRQITKAA